MYDILKGPDIFSRSSPAVPHGRQAKQNLRFDVEKVILRRRTLGRRVDASHGLIRLLGSLNVSLGLRDSVYVEAVSSVALQIANSLRLTSPWGAGHPHNPGWCYGPGVDEVLICTVEGFDLNSARDDWEELMPLRVLAHSYNDFTLPYLDGTGEGLSGSGTVVLVLNIPMLAFQHKCWWERYVKDNPDSPPSINLFFNAYPLANLLRSHTDLTLANRLFALGLGDPIVPQNDPNPFYMNFYPATTDRMLEEALVYMRKRSLTFDDWLSAVPCLYVEDYHDWLRVPDLAFTTQMEWAIFLARLPVLSQLVRFNQEQKSAFNQPYLNQIGHWVRRMLNGRLFGHGLRGDSLKAVLNRIDQTIVPYL